MHNKDWDDLRYLLCVASTGSVLQAAKKLGVNHATVLRHVASFEERYNTTVFERTARGYRLLPDSAHIIRAAEAAEIAMDEVARLASGARVPRSETIRITSTDTLCTYVLPRFVSEVGDTAHGHKLVLLSSNTHIDLLREQAHIVVRPSVTLADDLVGTVAGELSFSAYAVDDSVTKWLGLSGALTRSIAGRWLAENIAADSLGHAADSFMILAAMAARGKGIAFLPRFVGDATPGLQELPNRLPDLRVPIWVARHIEAQDSIEAKSVTEKLAAFLQSNMTSM